MEALFLELVKMSMTGTLFAFAVLLLRPIFRKAPKWLFCLLWGVVALRLIVPVSIESSFSLIPDRLASGQVITEIADGYIGDVDYIYEDSAAYDAAINAGREPIHSSNGYYVITAKDSLEAPATVANTVIPALSWVWFAGMLLMTLYILLSFVSLKCRVATATIYRDNIRQSEQVDSPFVLGFFYPIIYLPYQLNESDMSNVIAHEQAHIRRRDHWWKPIGFLILSFHWFNPVMWIVYILLCRDIEAACDEKVIKHMEKDEMRAYSTALLNCSVHRRRIAACPLAFGEVGVRERIKRVMNYKKPAFWIIVIAVIACITAAACFLTNPREKNNYFDGQMLCVKIQDSNGSLISEADLGEARYNYFDIHTFRNVTLPGAVTVDFSIREVRKNAVEIAFNGPLVADSGEVWKIHLTPGQSIQLYTPTAGGNTLYTFSIIGTDERLFDLLDGIVNNTRVAASSNPYDYINARRTSYNEILTYGNMAVDCFVDEIRTAKTYGLREYIMAAACSEITGIGVKEGEYDTFWWGSAGEWLALYDAQEVTDIVPIVIATDCIDGLQAKMLSFGYSYNRPFGSAIACGIAPWQGNYCDANTLILDGLMGQNQILLSPQGFSLSRYKIYLPDGTVYDDGTRELYDSLSLRVMYSEQGISLIAPFTPGEYIYEVELVWDEYDMTVTYGMKVVMTGRESTYDVALDKVFDQYGEGNPLLAVSLINKFTLANAASTQNYYVFELENLPEGTKYIGVSTDGKVMYEMSPDDPSDIIGLIRPSDSAETQDDAKDSFIPESEYSAIIDSASFDIDGDGRNEMCTLGYGPTSGLFSFRFFASGENLKCNNVFINDVYDLSFEADENGKMRIRAETPGEPAAVHYFDISVVDGNIVLSEDGNNLAYWGPQGVDSSYAGG